MKNNSKKNLDNSNIRRKRSRNKNYDHLSRKKFIN